MPVIAAFGRELAMAIGRRPPSAVPVVIAKMVMPYAVLSMTSTVTMSNAKAKTELGWSPAYRNIHDGLSASGS